MPTDLFTRINDFAISTPWLHGPMTAYASFGLVLFAGLMVVGWWLAREYQGAAHLSGRHVQEDVTVLWGDGDRESQGGIRLQED